MKQNVLLFANNNYQVYRFFSTSSLVNSFDKGVEKKSRYIHEIGEYRKELFKTSLQRLIDSVSEPEARVSTYIGLTVQQLHLKHQNFHMIDCRPGEAIMECRTPDATITCEIKNGLCRDAWLFTDQPIKN